MNIEIIVNTVDSCGEFVIKVAGGLEEEGSWCIPSINNCQKLFLSCWDKKGGSGKTRVQEQFCDGISLLPL